MIGKALAVIGATVGAITVVDKLNSGTWWWEKVSTVQRLENQNRVRLEVQRQLANAERLRLAKEKQALTQGRYNTTQAHWSQQPSAINYGLSHY